MITPLRGIAQGDFKQWLKKKGAYWIWRLAPSHFKLVFIQLFFHDTELKVVVTYRVAYGYDWVIVKDYANEVLISAKIGGNNYRTYNEALSDGIATAVGIYNVRKAF